MKRTITTILLTLAVATAVGVVVWRHVLPLRRVSDLYRHYEYADGIAASYIHNYHVNDTITLDVTLLEATTDSAWQALCTDFAISDIIGTMEDIDPRAVFSRLVSRHDYSQVILGDSPDAEILAISCDTKTFSIFHIHDTTEIHAVFWHNYQNNEKKTNHIIYIKQ